MLGILDRWISAKTGACYHEPYSMEELQQSLIEGDQRFSEPCFVFQYNKRDVPGAVSVRELEATFNPMHKPYFEAVANRGTGVMETLQAVSQSIIRELKGGET